MNPEQPHFEDKEDDLFPEKTESNRKYQENLKDQLDNNRREDAVEKTKDAIRKKTAQDAREADEEFKANQKRWEAMSPAQREALRKSKTK